MMVDDLIRVGRLLAGAALLVVGMVPIWRKSEISVANGVVLGLGALMFAIPILSSFTFKTSNIEFSGRANRSSGCRSQARDL
jgi:hypothetical protein